MKQRPRLIGNPLVQQTKILSKDALDLERAATQAFNTRRTRFISQVNKSPTTVIPINTVQSFPTQPTSLPVLMLITEYGPPSLSNQPAHQAILKYSEGVWSLYQDSPTGVSSDPFGANTPPNVYDLFEEFSNTRTNYWLSSNWIFSSSDGKSFVPNSGPTGSANNCFIARDISGRLWNAAYDIDNNVTIYKSEIGDGSDWTLVQSFTNSEFLSSAGFFQGQRVITCSPLDKDVIAIHATDTDNAPIVIISTDGSTFSKIVLPAFDTPQSYSDGGCVFLSTGRLIVSTSWYENGPVTRHISTWISDDYSSFTRIDILPSYNIDDFGYYEDLYVDPSDTIFCVFGRELATHYYPAVLAAFSNDLGESWTEIPTPFIVPDGQTGTFFYSAWIPGYGTNSFYDPITDDLWVFFGSFDTTYQMDPANRHTDVNSRVGTVWKCHDPKGAAIWTDEETTIKTAAGFTYPPSAQGSGILAYEGAL